MSNRGKGTRERETEREREREESNRRVYSAQRGKIFDERNFSKMLNGHVCTPEVEIKIVRRTSIRLSL